MDPNRGGSGRSSSLLLWALLASVVGAWLFWQWAERRERIEAETSSIYGGYGE